MKGKTVSRAKTPRAQRKIFIISPNLAGFALRFTQGGPSTKAQDGERKSNREFIEPRLCATIS
jgi:hypothetical protein